MENNRGVTYEPTSVQPPYIDKEANSTQWRKNPASSTNVASSTGVATYRKMTGGVQVFEV